MDFKAVDHSVNILALKKDNVNYAMCYAWAVMLDYDKIGCLLGSQSVTGKAIKKGDIVGFSSLGINQKNIALILGDNHSNEMDKLKGIDYEVNDSAILIKDAKTMVVCEVIDILHLEGIEEDNFIYLKMLSKKENEGKFLHMSDL